MGNLNNLFNPQSVAVIGASDKEDSVGRAILTNLLQAGDRKIFPVNPNKKTILGLKCFQDTASIGEHVDLAVIATPARSVPKIVEDCGRAGVGAAVIVSADFGDLIDFLGDDEYTRSILLYMEDIGNARKFMSASRAFAMHKPVIVLKPERFTEETGAAVSRAGAMAGDDAIYEAAFKRVGVIRVKEIADLFDVAEVLESRRLPPGPGLAIVTAAGGPGLMAMDTLKDLGGKPARLSPETLERLNRLLPPFRSEGNPVDIPGDVDAARYGKAIGICLEDPGVDGVLVIYIPTDTAPPDETAGAVLDSAKGAGKPVLTVWMGSRRLRPAVDRLAQNDIPTYETPEEAVKAYVNMYRYKKNLALLYETPAELPGRETPPGEMKNFAVGIADRKEHLKNLIKETAGAGRTVLNEEESKQFLAAYGIPVTTPVIARNVEDAVRAARETGYPLVIKIVSPDIIDKTDTGGVAVDIRSEEELRRCCASMMTTVRKRAPKASIEGIAVQRMVGSIDYELILGSRKDKNFGAVIIFGMGGSAAELIRDLSVGLPPLNQTLAKRLMEETKAYKLMQGRRRKPPADLEEIEMILVRFSYLVVDFPEIAGIDIDPLAISADGARALDARIVLDTDYRKSASPYPHLVITPYPTRFIMPWNLPDGTEVLLRPIRPEDEPLEREFLSTLSGESLRTRFFSPLRDITHEWLVMFCNIDYDRHVAIVSEITEDGKRKITGVARIIINPDFNSGELTLIVHDRFQRRGIGQKLMEVIIRIGKWKGLHEINGEVLTDNTKMLKLCRKVGFTTKWLPGGTTRIVLPLK